MEICPVCGKEVYSGIRIGGKLHHYECFSLAGLEPISKHAGLDVCALLRKKFSALADEMKGEPERAEKRMTEAEEKIRRYRDRIFDEQGRLIDPEGLKRALENQIQISEENARILLAKMGAMLEIAEEINCPNATEMRRIHDQESFPILTSVFPKMREKIAQRFR